MTNPVNVWEQTWKILAIGIVYELRKLHNNSEFEVEDNRFKYLCMLEIEKVLLANGKSLKAFHVQGSPKAELLLAASLIIWDEAPMVNKYAFEALDRMLRDIMRFQGLENSEKPFGGKVVVLGGDFRQILLVIPKGSRANIVMSTINSSRLWRFCKVLTLTKNMRLFSNTNNEFSSDLHEFAQWVLDIGDGNLGDHDDGESNVLVAEDLVLNQSSNPIADIVYSTYPNIIENIHSVR
ncbi:uncharacterized protein LOC130744207 [Lotus japonicus]|uniref:uncharacterized protein LOC130744207 n=1 Tax=Lotus japonicus TaxID=34305 RepID=UPI00258C7773|nr:uncharacterized protein LOC130744207 [Lotus japonicus]